jgi:hypothetical protein
MTARWREALLRVRALAVSRPYTVFALLVLPGLGAYLAKRADSEWESVYVLAARHLKHGEYLYNPQDGYLYPPFTAWAALPFTTMSATALRATWVLVNLACVVAILRWAWRLAGGGALEGKAGVPWREHTPAILGALCGLPYLHNCLVHQQTDVLLAALLVGGCLLLARSRSFTAATCFGLAAAVKCTALLWVPYLLWRRQPQAAAWLLCVAVGVNLLPDLVSRPSSGRTWLAEYGVQFLRPLTDSASYPGSWGSDILYNQSLAGAGQRWLARTWEFGADGWSSRLRDDPPRAAAVRAAVYAVQAGLLLSVLLVCRRPFQKLGEAPENRARLALEGSVVLLLMLLLSPMSSKAHFGVLVLPGFCLARRAIATRGRLQQTVFFLALVLGLVSNKDPIGDLLYSLTLWYGFTTWQTLLLLAGCLLALGTNRLPTPLALPDAFVNGPMRAEPSGRAA